MTGEGYVFFLTSLAYGRYVLYSKKERQPAVDFVPDNATAESIGFNPMPADVEVCVQCGILWSVIIGDMVTIYFIKLSFLINI
jgi:hypothetical protein